ncbi:MAG: AMP-binding protein [Acetobacteraceae bacterium]|nr:AMP-binding protein [Acetobacteraceae bacterium]
MRGSADWAGWTIGRALRRAADLWPAHAFLIEGEERLSFAGTAHRSGLYASALLAQGVGRGDVVATWLPNCTQWALVWLACCRIGAAVVPLSTRYRAHEAEYVLRQSRARVLVMADRLWGTDTIALISDFLPEILEPRDAPAGTVAQSCVLRSKRLPALRHVVLHGRHGIGRARTLEAVLEAGTGTSPRALRAAEAAVTEEDTAIIVYTSGTSGRPKGAMQAHRILRNGANIARSRHYEPGDVVLGHMPFYHVAGSVATLIPALQWGQSVALMASWEPSDALRLITREPINVFGGIPTHFIDLLRALDGRRLAPGTIRSAWIGGANVPAEVARAASERLGIVSLAAVYGMTETGGVTTYTEWGAPIDLVSANKGKPIGDFELRVADPLTGAGLRSGEEGEVHVRGYLVMQGYFDDEPATRAATTTDGWFRTGDLGRLDPDGNLAITGRLKEMFIVGGTNAYPAEIEAFLHRHPAIAQAMVCGVPDARLGEVCFAFVEPRPEAALTAAEVIGFCRGGIADYKVPRFVEILVALPRTATNKIERHALQARARRIAAGSSVSAAQAISAQSPSDGLQRGLHRPASAERGWP